jgi:hypothetical protein
MATVSYAFFSWLGSPSTDLHPGQTHQWELSGGNFNYGDAIMVTAHPVARQGRALAVENTKTLNNGQAIFSFVVKNVGSVTVPGYGMGFAWVDQ